MRKKKRAKNILPNRFLSNNLKNNCGFIIPQQERDYISLLFGWCGGVPFADCEFDQFDVDRSWVYFVQSKDQLFAVPAKVPFVLTRTVVW